MSDIYVDPSAAANGGGASATDPYNNFDVFKTWAADMGGDTCFIKAGTTFRGQVSTVGTASNYNVMPYGDGDKPKLKASSLESFTHEGNDIWYTGNISAKASVFLDGQYVDYVDTKPELVVYSVWQTAANNPIYIKMGPGENPNGSVEVATFTHALNIYAPVMVRDLQVFHGIDTACALRDLVDDVQLISVDAFWGGSPTDSSGRNCFELKGQVVAEDWATNVRVKYCTAVGAENNAFELWWLDGAKFIENRFGGSLSNEFELWHHVKNSSFERNTVVSDSSNKRTRSYHLARLFGNVTTVGLNDNNIFKNNIADGGASSAIVVEALCDDTKIYNNTFKNYGADLSDSGEVCGLRCDGSTNPPTGTEFKGNIIESTKSARLGSFSNGITVAHENNIYWNPRGFPKWAANGTIYQSLAAWNALGNVTGERWESAQLGSDYLPGNANCIDGGVDSLGVLQDVNRLARSGTPDMGAVEKRVIPLKSTFPSFNL